MQIKPILSQSISNVSNILDTVPKQNDDTVYPVIRKLPSYPISFCSAQIQQHSKGSTPYIAKQLKALEGTLDEKLLKAKDIILKDMGLPSDLVNCVDQDLGGKGYAAYSAPLGKVIFDKKFCQKPDSEFSDEAVLCILRHELDHMEVFTKLYKKLGPEEFEKLISVFFKNAPEKMPKINHEFYKEMSKYVNIDNFDADKYINAINNYYMAHEWESKYKNFTDIAKNFDNALEDSAREKQYELEELMGVTTLKDFYQMINETKKLTSEIKAKGITDEQTIEERFNNLFAEALKSTGLEDKTQNWGKIIKEARILNNKLVGGNYLQQ